MRYNFFNSQFDETTTNSDKLAVCGSDKDISWSTLHALISKLLSVFEAIKIKPGCPVIIYGHKESLFPVCVLACMHSDITYIPIDKIYPLERIKKIQQATNAQVLINCSASALEIDIPVLINNNLELKIISPPDFSRPVYEGTDPLRYIMFTSGSTGEPKGVQITKTSVLSYLDWVLKDYGFSGEDIFMNQAPFTFDVSLCDVLNAFAHGGTLVLTSEEIVKHHELFFERLKKYHCTVWTSTPSFVYIFLRNQDFKGEGFGIKTFLFMGEELPNRTCSLLKQKFPASRILNAYGPTEATIVTTLVEITDDVIRKHSLLPIGYPRKDSKMLVEKTDPSQREGELVIVGDHVSIGYYNNEELNKQKFFIHEGQRAFRTGDLGYYENDLLFCIGRNDDQVKMHGYRIELSEISSVLSKSELVQDACTIALKRNNEVKKIVSFIIPATVADNLNVQLKAYLEPLLPYYMIPGDFMIVDAFPYSISHKIDKNKLIETYISTMQ
jgi:D-alanine--poly(phosphoribitol) ligase subunit 1